MDLVEVTSYRRATDRAALTLAPGETLLAGGTWLFSERQREVAGLVDLTTLGWTPYETTATAARVSATCTIADLMSAADDLFGSAAPLVGQCADALLMSFKVQHQATVGGNVCLALPAGAMTSLFTALDAEAVMWTPDGGERRLPVADLVVGVRRTSLAPGEVLRALEIPLGLRTARTAMRRVSLAPMGRTGAMVTASSRPGSVLFSLTGGVTHPVVLRFPLVPDADALDAALSVVGDWHVDGHGDPLWRAAMTRRMAQECREELAQ